MDYRRLSHLILFFILLAVPSYGQTGYEISARPDVWYNDVDGIQIGTVFEGGITGMHEGGPHRLETGIWLGTWFPSVPVSYFMKYTEPVTHLSEYGSEFNIQLFSAVREGYHTHGISVNKRWQDAFEYMNYWETGVGYNLENRFDHEYTVFPLLWSDHWKGVVHPYLAHQNLNRAGIFNMNLSGRMNTVGDLFFTASVVMTQQIFIEGDWEIRLRGYGEILSPDSYPEYLILLGSGPEITTLGNRISRAKGSVPDPWVRGGHVHFSGGPNLRGYRSSDTRLLRNDQPRLYNSAGAFNVEFDFLNPVQTAIRSSQLSEFVSFRSYLFSDAAAVSGNTDSGDDGLFANGGAGLALSINIPDYLGKPRGFVIRYDVPFWISEPGDDNHWKWRHLLGFGATISF